MNQKQAQKTQQHTQASPADQKQSQQTKQARQPQSLTIPEQAQQTENKLIKRKTTITKTRVNVTKQTQKYAATPPD